MKTNRLMLYQTPNPTLTAVPTMNNLAPYTPDFEPAIDPPHGSPLRKVPYITTEIKGISFQGIIPRGFHGQTKRYRVEADTLAECIERLKNKTAEILRHGDGVAVKLSAQDAADALEARQKMDRLKIKVPLSILIGRGVEYLEVLYRIAEERDAKGNKRWERWDDIPDLVNLGIKALERQRLTLGEALEKFVKFIPKSRHKPLVEGRTQAAAIKSLLGPMVDHFGADRPFCEVSGNHEGLLVYADKWIHSEDAGTVTTRQKRWQESNRFLRIMNNYVDATHEILDKILGNKPETGAISITAPSPEAIAAVLHYQLRKDPDLLFYTILQVFCGVRPEEAYRLLSTARQNLFVEDSFVFLPREGTKGKVGRKIRLRPAFLAWLAHVPGLSDPDYDLVPKNSKGVPYTADELQDKLNRQLHRIGRWTGRLPKETLRKSWVSACVALDIPKAPFLILEAGHTDVFVIDLHYDARWGRAKGLRLFSIFPVTPKTLPSEWDLYRAHGQAQEGL